jgi:hypothetical protein
MTYRELYENATRKLDKSEITLGEYEEMTKPLEEEVRTWIPVGERLPEDKTDVLTTIKVSDRIPQVRSGFYYGEYFHNDNGDSWSATDEEVTAWMPLPEPYKAESEDGE